MCGITCVEDALAAALAGADAIGLLFHPPSTRNVSMATAEQILAALPPFVDPVGLFVDTPIADVASHARHLQLRWIQLHGHETPSQVAELGDFQVIKAIHVKPDQLQETLAPWREAIAKGLPNLRGLVLETGTAAGKGGTGIENDWEQIAALQAAGGFTGLPALILAGGLHPANVAAVITRLHPYAVDVSSGIEETKGRKSVQRINDFLREVRTADHQLAHEPTSP